MIDITERYNRDKESTIQYDISELLQIDLSDYLKACLMNLDNPIICKFVALFPLQDKSKISTIRNSLNGMKDHPYYPKSFIVQSHISILYSMSLG